MTNLTWYQSIGLRFNSPELRQRGGCWSINTGVTTNLTHVRFSVTPKPTDIDERLKPTTRPYHQEISRGAAVTKCCYTDTPTAPPSNVARGN